MGWRAMIPTLLIASVILTDCGGESRDAGDDAARDPGTSAPASASSSDDPATDLSACELLTVDEVAAAVGAPVKAGIATSGPAATGGDFTTCVWQSDDPAHPADTATLTVYANADAADSVRSGDSVDLPGLGNAAFSDAVSSVWVYVGDRSFFAQWYVFNTMDDEGLAQSKALAQAAADALG